jgi:HSP90 family molecular chaperone
MKIKIEFDKDARIVTIIDNGTGMTKQDLIQNLGTPSKSAATNFLDAIKKGSPKLILLLTIRLFVVRLP